MGRRNGKVGLRGMILGVWVVSMGSMGSLLGQSALEAYSNESLSVHELDQTAWQKTADAIDYAVIDETVRDTTDKNQDKRKKSEGDTAESSDIEWESHGQASGFETFFGPIFKFLLIVGAIVLIAFLLIKLLNAEHLFSPKNRKIKGRTSQIDIENIEENLYESDLEQFIQQALAEKNYALAIRLYYLAILKELSLSGQIKWKKDKTNREYIAEMGGKNLSSKFRETTLIFERVWYGSEELTADVFEEIAPKFKAVLAESASPLFLKTTNN